MADSAQAERDAIRRRIAGWRAAEQREIALRRDEPILVPARSFELALELCELDLGDLGIVDPVRERGVFAARASWSKLRNHFRCHPRAKHQP